jgi:hypothetical protein
VCLALHHLQLQPQAALCFTWPIIPDPIALQGLDGQVDPQPVIAAIDIDAIQNTVAAGFPTNVNAAEYQQAMNRFRASLTAPPASAAQDRATHDKLDAILQHLGATSQNPGAAPSSQRRRRSEDNDASAGSDDVSDKDDSGAGPSHR